MIQSSKLTKNMIPKLQLALDYIDLDEATTMLREVEKEVDIVEAGTPLLKAEGMKATLEALADISNKPLVADLKVADVADIEFGLAAACRANYVTLLAASPNENIADGLKKARDCDLTIVADLLGVEDYVKRAQELAEMGIEHIGVHCGISEQRQGKTIFTKAKEISKEEVLKRAKKFRNMYKSYLRIKTYPAFSANSEDIKRELDDIEYVDGVKVDAVIVDYIDILGPESGYEPGSRNEIDAKWKNFKNIAATRNCLVVTADQSNKQTYKRNIELGDTSEDKRKNAHIDLKVAINQKSEKKIDEKEDGVMRFSVIAKRHGGFNPKKQVWVLNQLTLGQTLIDSEWKR